MSLIYQRDEGDYRYPRVLPQGAVVEFDNGVVFKCPCGKRQVYVSSPPHRIAFDSEERLTLNGSVGSREKLRLPEESPESGTWKQRPANWCHFWIKGGQAEMVSDARCPGGTQ